MVPEVCLMTPKQIDRHAKPWAQNKWGALTQKNIAALSHERGICRSPVNGRICVGSQRSGTFKLWLNSTSAHYDGQWCKSYELFDNWSLYAYVNVQDCQSVCIRDTHTADGC
jgi:hypothetical protein